jgi:RNA polymerase sigma factor (sigma-70 family)
MTTTAATTTARAEVETASEPHSEPQPRGRSGNGAAAARTEQLFAQYGRTVNGLCRALLRDRAEAEDAAQQTFLSAHRALMNGSNPREPAAWLATIARNECWSRIRTRMREPLAAEEVGAVSSANDPLNEAIRRADLRALWLAIEELPHKQRDALLLREFGGMSYGELAAALAVSGSAVESLLFRARDGLRGKLRAIYGAITGASWLEAIVRIAVGGGAPVATKVAVLGLGAAAVGSGAVVVPHTFDNHRPVHGSPRTPAAVVVKLPKALVVHEIAAQVVTPAPAPVVVQRAVVRKEDSGHDEAVAHSSRQEGRGGGDDAETRPAVTVAPAVDSRSHSARGRVQGSGGDRGHGGGGGADRGGGGNLGGDSVGGDHGSDHGGSEGGGG